MEIIQRCKGCNEPLTEENNSEAHIIPNALGGRLAPKGIICRQCNGKLDKLADNALIKAFHGWPTLLGLPRQRGPNPQVILDTDKGSKVRVGRDGNYIKMDVGYEVEEIEDGHVVKITAGESKTVKQLVNRAAKQFPQLQDHIEGIEQHFRTGKVPGDELFKIGIQIGPEDTFGGVATAIWLFMHFKTGHGCMDWDGLVNYIKSCQCGNNLKYFTNGFPGLKGPPIKLAHKIIVKTNHGTGEMIAYVEILNILKVGGIFAKGPRGVVEEHIYVYDLYEKRDRTSEFSIQNDVFFSTDWNSYGKSYPADKDEIRDYALTELRKLEAYYHELSGFTPDN